jgi:nitrite reductase/ring-hydroxylating ferredoxin subunit
MRIFNYKTPIMKKLLFLLLVPFLFNCNSDSPNNNNPYIPNYGFSTVIDLSLPTNSNLNFAGNGKIIQGGARGVIVFNTGSGFTAFDAACPNQALSACSTMTVSGINAVCACDNAKYSLFTGQSPGQQYPMKPYRVEVNGNTIRVYN